VQFGESGLSYEPQKLLGVYDSIQGDVLIGYYIPDFIIAERVVVEIKALKGLDNAHIAQAIGYLAVTACPIGLLINFGMRSLQWQRIFPTRNISDHRVNHQWLFVLDWLKQDQ
jgi:GxxExxY protein